MLDTIDWCMRLDHLERPQSVLALQKALLGQKDPDHKGEAPLMDQIKGIFSRFSKRPDDADRDDKAAAGGPTPGK